MKKNIAVIFGGRSPEYFVSLQSAYSVITNIDSEKYNVLPIGVTLEGDWFRYSGNYRNIPDGTWPADAASRHFGRDSSPFNRAIRKRAAFYSHRRSFSGNARKKRRGRHGPGPV